MWFFKKKEIPKKYVSYFSVLKIFFIDGRVSTYRVKTTDMAIVRPWRDFYKWYFGREQSKKYIFKCYMGEDLILKDRIIHFSVNLKSEVSDHKNSKQTNKEGV